MNIDKLAQKIPDDDQNRELMLLVRLWVEAQKLKARADDLVRESDNGEDSK